MSELTQVQQLLQHYSDFYKELHGFRPSFGKASVDYTLEEAQALIDSCTDYLNQVASTAQGRQQLENEGWVFDHPSDYEHDPFRDDVEADADTLRSAGFGTDEDYGYADEIL